METWAVLDPGVAAELGARAHERHELPDVLLVLPLQVPDAVLEALHALLPGAAARLQSLFAARQLHVHLEAPFNGGLEVELRRVALHL